MSERARWLLRVVVMVAVSAYIYYLIMFLSPDTDLFAPR
jgi:hypothetical protein